MVLRSRCNRASAYVPFCSKAKHLLWLHKSPQLSRLGHPFTAERLLNGLTLDSDVHSLMCVNIITPKDVNLLHRGSPDVNAAMEEDSFSDSRCFS